jgi:hypothetical protein
MAALLLRVSLPGSDPPEVRPSGRIRRSSGVDSCQLLGAVRLGFLVVDTRRRDLVSGFSDRFKGSTAMTSPPRRWSLGACARRLPGCHRQDQAGSGMGAATAARRRLVLAAAVVVRWFRDHDVMFIMFGVICTSGELLQ